MKKRVISRPNLGRIRRIEYDTYGLTLGITLYGARVSRDSLYRDTRVKRYKLRRGTRDNRVSLCRVIRLSRYNLKRIIRDRWDNVGIILSHNIPCYPVYTAYHTA